MLAVSEYDLQEPLIQRGLGGGVEECLKRVTAVRKSATNLATDSQKPRNISIPWVQKVLPESDEVLLIDDIVTRGATVLGAVNIVWSLS